MPRYGEARRKLGGSLRCAELTCKSLPPNLGIGAKDSSNHLVAGSLRSFPQESSKLNAIQASSSMPTDPTTDIAYPNTNIIDCPDKLQ